MLGSGSLAFKEWLRAEGLQSTCDISNLANSKLAFDAEDYLISLLSNPQTREPLLPALGGLPFALQQHIELDLSNWQSANITPLFIFPGLDVACVDRRSTGNEAQKSVDILNEAWSVYDQGEGDEAVMNFGKACTYRNAHIMRYLFFYLHSKGVEVLVAPYNASAWMVYMDEIAKPSMIDGCVGSASCLVFGVSRLITGFDWEERKVFFADLKYILNKLMLTHDQLIDLCLLAGTSILPTMPVIESESSTPRMVAARNVMRQAGQDGHTACQQAKDDEYLGLFRKAKLALKFMVVILRNGEVKQLNFETCPMDAHEFLGHRLPSELVNYQTRGLIGNSVLNWRVRQEILELPPLDGGNSTTYKNLIAEQLRPLRARSLIILTHSLHRYFHKQDVDVITWPRENERRALGLKEMDFSDVTREAETWHVRESVFAVKDRVKDFDLLASPIPFALQFLQNSDQAKLTITPRKSDEHSILETVSELLANTVWRFLQDRGYIDSDHKLSPWGEALNAAFEKAESNGYLASAPAEACDAIFVAFELLKLDLLNSELMFPPPLYSGAPIRGSDTDKEFTLLISRVACLGKFRHANIGYTGPLSRHLLAYQQVTSAVRSSLRDLVEMHAANMMLSGSAVRIRKFTEYTDLGAHLPFNTEPDLGLALEVKSFLDESSASDPQRTKLIGGWFSHVIDFESDLRKAWRLWAAVNAGVQAASDSIISQFNKDHFREANLWLENKLRLVGHHIAGEARSEVTT